jgi:hypothetical protein
MASQNLVRESSLPKLATPSFSFNNWLPILGHYSWKGNIRTCTLTSQKHCFFIPRSRTRSSSSHFFYIHTITHPCSRSFLPVFLVIVDEASRLYMTLQRLVLPYKCILLTELSWPLTFSGPSSCARIFFASTFPSSTPIWSGRVSQHTHRGEGRITIP